MKKIFTLSFAALIAVVAGYFIFFAENPGQSSPSSTSFVSKEKSRMSKSAFLSMMADHQFMKLRDPSTDRIPAGIRARELVFASRLPVNETTRSQNWTWRGPANIGGRMLCVAVDMDNENHLLAGSASGGMWESNDQGQNWHKTTAPDAEQSATCIVQDNRPGKHHIWYYGTGEMLSTTDRNVSTNVRTLGIGNGIFKSTDNGSTWQPLASTQGGTPDHLSEIFQGVWRIVTDPVQMDKDIVYAACYGAIMRSDDGGESWQVVLADLENKSFGTDVAITSEGVIYAVMGGYGWGIEPPGKKGVWRSEDGFAWEKISPDGFPEESRVNRIVLAPSNNRVMYMFTESQSPDLTPFNGYTNTVNTFWKMTWDMAGDSALWEDRTSTMPGGGDGDINDFPVSFVVYGGYTFMMGVKPDDENVVFMGGMNAYRSSNGFADTLHTQYIGGYPYDMDSTHQLHPDQHGIAFLPSDPRVMFLSNDGGIYITPDCLKDSTALYWSRLNNMLTTTQFYSIAIDHSKTGDDWILGGLQDNNWYYTVTDDPSEFWFDINICYDGFATAVADDWEYVVISAYSGNIWTSQFEEDMHTKNIFTQLPDTLLAYYDPVMGSNSLFSFYQNMALDPNNCETFYLPTIKSIWRKDNMKAASYDTSLRNVGWSHLSNADIGESSEISYITVSRIPANRLYYGTSLGRLYRLDNAHTGNPVPVEITGEDFPVNGFLAYIDIDQADADHVMAVFSNYGVQSLFHSDDGGTTWEPVGGNLEEFPDGSGSGPSVRCSQKIQYQGNMVIFVGTTAGLYSTTELKGDSTVWVREGATSIGSVMVDMVDARSTDGFVAVGTHGNGVYSTYYDPSTGLEPEPASLEVASVYPNPARGQVYVNILTQRIQNVEIGLYNIEGRLVDLLFRERIEPGGQTFLLDMNGANPGIYYLMFKTEEGIQSRKVVLL
jgi:photosystem II stability/assembly factor-like uncharacterized protein